MKQHIARGSCLRLLQIHSMPCCRFVHARIKELRCHVVHITAGIQQQLQRPSIRYSTIPSPCHALSIQTHNLITPSIPPAIPPPLLPKRTIKLLLPQLNIHRVMRPTHPPSKPLLRLQCLLHIAALFFHPRLEILRAHPAGVQLREQAEECGCLFLVGRGGLRGV